MLIPSAPSVERWAIIGYTLKNCRGKSAQIRLRRPILKGGRRSGLESGTGAIDFTHRGRVRR